MGRETIWALISCYIIIGSNFTLKTSSQREGFPGHYKCLEKSLMGWKLQQKIIYNDLGNPPSKNLLWTKHVRNHLPRNTVMSLSPLLGSTKAERIESDQDMLPSRGDSVIVFFARCFWMCLVHGGFLDVYHLKADRIESGHQDQEDTGQMRKHLFSTSSIPLTNSNVKERVRSVGLQDTKKSQGLSRSTTLILRSVSSNLATASTSIGIIPRIRLGTLIPSTYQNPHEAQLLGFHIGFYCDDLEIKGMQDEIHKKAEEATADPSQI